MRLSTADARRLAERAMEAVGHEAGDAVLIADHLMDCELRGLAFGGLARAISIAERMKRVGDHRTPIRVVHETPVSAQIDGGDHIGYLVAYRAVEIALDKAEASGIAVVGARNTWYTGMLSYYAEMAAARGLVSIMASNTSPWVAPYGGTEGRLGTNPVCFGFPSTEEPVIWDIGTSAIIHAEVTLAKRLGQELAPDVAYDAEGRPTRDPAAALSGAFAAWGGAKGSGLNMVVQILGMLAGSPPLPAELEDFGFLIIALRPDILGATGDFPAKVASYAASVRGSRPVEGGAPVRMPFDRSRALRDERSRTGFIEVPDILVGQLEAYAERLPARLSRL